MLWEGKRVFRHRDAAMVQQQNGRLVNLLK